MIKNKLKLIIAFITIMIMFSTSFVFADEAEPAQDPADTTTNQNEENSQEAVPISTDSSEETPAAEQNLKKSDVYLTGDNVVVDYIVDGNLFVTANIVTINSQIGGDAFIVANQINIGEQSYIFSNLFACANELNIKGVVYDVYTYAKTVNVSGYIYRDAKIGAQNFNLLGTIGRNVFLSEVSNVSFTNSNPEEGLTSSLQGNIAGNLEYTSKNELSIPEGVVSGDISYTQSSQYSGNTISDYLLRLGSFLALLAIMWLLLLWLAPKFLNKTSELLTKKVGPVVGFGILGLIATPIIAAILLIIGITASASILLLGIYMLFLMASTSIVVIAINNIVCNKLNVSKLPQKFGMLIIAGIIVWAIFLIPYVGTFLSFVTAILGLGIILTNLFTRNKTQKVESNEKVVEKVSDKSQKKSEE